MKNMIKKTLNDPFVSRAIRALTAPLGGPAGQKGFILILALVTMLAMSLIGISLLMNISTDTALARNERNSKMAFQLAEAGVNEAIARLHLPTANARYIGEKDTDADYRTIDWNVNNSDTRNFGVSSGDANRRSAIGPNGANMNYDVTITYLTENNPEGFCDNNSVSLAAPLAYKGVNSLPVVVPPGTLNCAPPEVVMFGRDFNIDQSVTKIQRGIMPVYHVFSTGSVTNASGGATTTRQIEAYIGASSLNIDSGAALNTNGCTVINGGSAVINGGSTCGSGCPAPTANCTADNTADLNMSTTYLGDTITNIAAMADMKLACNSVATCNALISGTTDADWGDYTGGTYSRMIYINNVNPTNVQVTISGNDLGADRGGRGILLVQGDLKLTGGFQWYGLIYVLGTLTLDGGGGGVNITGGAMANTTVNVNGGLNLNYDLKALQDVGRESSASAMLIWKKY